MADLKTKAIVEAQDKASASFAKVGQTLRKRLAPALGRVTRAATRAGKAIAKVGLAAGAIAGAAAIKGIYSLVESTAELGDNLAKAAVTAGVSAQTLAELQHAAKAGGISADEMTESIAEFTMRLGQAKAGEGSMLGFLQKVNPGFAQLVLGAESSEEALGLMLEAIGKIPDQARRAALADAAFGGAGKKMAGLLAQGTEAVDRSRASFRKYFGTLDKEGLKAAEDFRDSQLAVNTAIDGTKFSIGSKLLPVLTPLLIKLADWVAANRDMIATKVSEYISGLANWIASVDWTKVLEGVEDFFSGVGKVLSFLWDIKDVLLAIAGALVLGKLIGVLGTVIGTVKTLVDWFRKGKTAAAGMAAAQAAGGRAGAVGAAAGAAGGRSRGGKLSAGLAAAGPVAAGVWAISEVESALGGNMLDKLKGKMEQAKVLDAQFEELGINIGGKLIDALDMFDDKTIWKVAEERLRLLQTHGVEAARRGMGFRSEVESERQMTMVRAQQEAMVKAAKEGRRATPQEIAMAQHEAIVADIRGAIVVKFEDAPEGMRVEQAKSGTEGLDVKADVGRRPAAAEAL